MIFENADLQPREVIAAEKWERGFELALAKLEYSGESGTEPLAVDFAIRLFRIVKHRLGDIRDPQALEKQAKSLAEWCARKVIDRAFDDIPTFEHERGIWYRVTAPVLQEAAAVRLSILRGRPRRLLLKSAHAPEAERSSPKSRQAPETAEPHHEAYQPPAISPDPTTAWDAGGEAEMDTRPEPAADIARVASDLDVPPGAQQSTVEAKREEAHARKGDITLLQRSDGTMLESVRFPTAEQYAGIKRRRREQLTKDGTFRQQGKGLNRKITVESLIAFCPPQKDAQ